MSRLFMKFNMSCKSDVWYLQRMRHGRHTPRRPADAAAVCGLELLAQFRAGDTIKAHTRFSSLYGQFPMNIRRNPDHEFSAKMCACDRFRNCFPIFFHVQNYISDKFSNSL